jgi:hypothetical protein
LVEYDSAYSASRSSILSFGLEQTGTALDQGYVTSWKSGEVLRFAPTG